jgi:hypothetical protein
MGIARYIAVPKSYREKKNKKNVVVTRYNVLHIYKYIFYIRIHIDVSIHKDNFSP